MKIITPSPEYAEINKNHTSDVQALPISCAVEPLVTYSHVNKIPTDASKAKIQSEGVSADVTYSEVDKRSANNEQIFQYIRSEYSCRTLYAFA